MSFFASEEAHAGMLGKAADEVPRAPVQKAGTLWRDVLQKPVAGLDQRDVASLKRLPSPPSW
jgi:hypothetical protein